MPLNSPSTDIESARRGRGTVPRAVAIVVASLLAAFAGLWVAPSAHAAATLPAVIPSIDGWKAGTGSFFASPQTLVVDQSGDAAVQRTATLFSSELDPIMAAGAARAKAVRPGPGRSSAARPGDIVLALNAARTDLGSEGYELTVGDTITITAAKPVGVFYGTRTVLQMLRQQLELPQGSVVDVPAYGERGVTLCACVINISPKAIDALIEEMSFLKLNTLLLELKVKVSKYPATNTWSYYTKDQIKALVAKAAARGIDVIPEINSPGHMDPWLPARPDLQLVSKDGVKDPVRMDITKPESLAYYQDLIDEYSEVFTSRYWHMGLDEYMLGSGFGNYPQLLQAAHDQFGPDATENDLIAAYANKVNDYVKSKGKVLRMWNDGVGADNKVVRFDTDIHVEHWIGWSISSQQVVDWGHTISNVSANLYMVRGGYTVNTAQLYADKWTPLRMNDGTIASGQSQVTGARVSAWPDGGTPQEAENTTLQRLYEPLRFVAQATWSNSHPWATYADFKSSMDTVGRNPAWGRNFSEPVADGAVKLTALGAGSLAAGSGNGVVVSQAGETLTVTRTADGYHTITSSDGRCLDLSRAGTMALNVPVEIGADVTLATCDNTTLQRWRFDKVEGGYEIVNAASQMGLVIAKGLTNVPVVGQESKTVPDGKVVQAPSDWTRTTWSLAPDVNIALTTSTGQAQPGDQVSATYTVTNPTSATVAGATLSVARLPQGWAATPQSVSLGDLGPGATRSGTFTLTNTSGSGTGSFGFDLTNGSGQVVATATATVNAVCATGTLRPTAVTDVDSEQLSGEPAPSGPAAAAIDGNPSSYWHTQWSPSNAPYPHAIVVDLGSVQNICGLTYTGRADASNGRIADYEVYTSSTTSTIAGDWGTAATSGTFANNALTQRAEFAPRAARYVKLVARSEVNGNPWTTVAELRAVGPAPAG